MRSASISRREFLGIVGEKAAAEGLPIERVQANLMELGCLADASVDYAVCLFSTLGMIRGRANRLRRSITCRRILKPGGTFVVHVHNRWHNLRDPQGRRWLLREPRLGTLARRRTSRATSSFPTAAFAKCSCTSTRSGSSSASCAPAGFQVRELIPLDTARRHALPRPWFFGRLRANGWIADLRRL